MKKTYSIVLGIVLFIVVYYVSKFLITVGVVLISGGVERTRDTLEIFVQVIPLISGALAGRFAYRRTYPPANEIRHKSFKSITDSKNSQL